MGKLPCNIVDATKKLVRIFDATTSTYLQFKRITKNFVLKILVLQYTIVLGVSSIVKFFLGKSEVQISVNG